MLAMLFLSGGQTCSPPAPGPDAADDEPAEPMVVGATTSGADVLFPGCVDCGENTATTDFVRLEAAFIDPAFDDLSVVLCNPTAVCLKVRVLLGREGSGADAQDCGVMYLTTTTIDAGDTTIMSVPDAAALKLTEQVIVQGTILDADSGDAAACERCESAGGPSGCCGH
jgi:hypothetical protein